MHVYKCTNERTRRKKTPKHITIIDTTEKEYNHTWQNNDNTNWTIEIWKKTI